MVIVKTREKIIQPFSKGLELVLSQETVQVDGHVTVVCEEELEGSAMVTTMEELFSPTLPAGSTVSKTFKWLLVNLPSLPHFDAVRATCCFTLRQVRLLGIKSGWGYVQFRRGKVSRKMLKVTE